MRIDDLSTPAALVDCRIVEANLVRAQSYADAHGLKLRPHIKTHKLPVFAHRQIELGATGITCQKLGEAEVMANAGIVDIFISYNIIGKEKLARLRSLHERRSISVSADNAVTVAGYAAAFRDAAHPLPVLVECDTGGERCGVQSIDEAVRLARNIDAAPGLHFEGLMTYPAEGQSTRVEAFMRAAIASLVAAGLSPSRVSNGGSPDLYSAAEVNSATEHRPGTYIYSDRMQVEFGLGSFEDCALTVLATVVSCPTVDRVIIDAGSKALSADLCDSPGHGHIIEYPQAVLETLNEEHGIANFSHCKNRPSIGDRVRVIPNHVCVVTNLFDTVYLTNDGVNAEPVPVAARGRMQ